MQSFRNLRTQRGVAGFVMNPKHCQVSSRHRDTFQTPRHSRRGKDRRLPDDPPDRPNKLASAKKRPLKPTARFWKTAQLKNPSGYRVRPKAAWPNKKARKPPTDESGDRKRPRRMQKPGKGEKPRRRSSQSKGAFLLYPKDAAPFQSRVQRVGKETAR